MEGRLESPTEPVDQENLRQPDSEEEDDQFVYPGSENSPQTEQLEVPASRQVHASPAQLESLYAAASTGDLTLLKKLFKTALENGDVEPFSLANDASSRTGFTALHAAASRGYLDITRWLIEDCGAMPDLEDREGESALHKAALNGHMPIIQYLVPAKAEVQARDADGWTALHNVCSKGYLDIVRYLCEKGNATAIVDGVRGVDVQSKDGWTPLMNAASKGHLPVVLYLLTKQKANPLVRNKWGETAYDIAAAVFEVWICEILQQAESEKWRGTATPYNTLLVHTTIPITLYENQRLDARLKTVATSGGRPKFSASGLGRNGRNPPFELKLPVTDEETSAKTLPAWRSAVQLPLREAPWVMPRPATMEQPALEGVERSHFWLSDWTLDVTHPSVDAEEGWQYAPSFDTPDDRWTAEMPPQLGRIMTTHGIVSAGLGGSSSRPLSSPHSSRTPQNWVRRRRWVRIMRRRLDIPPLPFLDPDGSMYYLDANGALIPYIEHAEDDDHGQELSAMSTTRMSSAQDYVARARYLVGSQSYDADMNQLSVSAVDARRAIAKLERATMELRQGILSDEDQERKIQAEVLLNAYSRDLERRRLAAGAQGLLLSDYDDEFEGDEEISSDEEFVYPQSPSEPVSRPISRASASTAHSGRVGVSRAPSDLTQHLTQAPDFRVPTREAPQKAVATRWTPAPQQLQAQWERDDAVQQCRDCQRRFNFLNRRVRFFIIIVKRPTNPYRSTTAANPSDVVTDPASHEAAAPNVSHRVCQSCYEETTSNIPSRLNRTSTMERIIVDQERLTIPGSVTRRESSSQLSDLADCPVCNQNLDDVGDAQAQESHVKSCLEGGAATPQTAKYLVYRLPAESALLGVECVICLEEFDLSLLDLAVSAAFITPVYLPGFNEAKVAQFMPDS
ncbi:hypothetical protein CVT24_003631 [Panaeolus cyanescens]|uniref:Uncharacterized protein n=1 Tax=Panaeolus cyanescens TaxID=181874 RepID=A0A409Y824_9AGAR|nr:hypothetical protein CVT24_003631 [Panaeolus cyanescens]